MILSHEHNLIIEFQNYSIRPKENKVAVYVIYISIVTLLKVTTLAIDVDVKEINRES
jgi:hypothetical protein